MSTFWLEVLNLFLIAITVYFWLAVLFVWALLTVIRK